MKSKRARSGKRRGMLMPLPAAPAAWQEPCLVMLRETAMAVRETILLYLGAANALSGNQRELFLAVAEDEMRHFVTTMQLIAVHDAVQAKTLEEAGLDVFVVPRLAVSKWAGGWPPTCGPLPIPPPDNPGGPAAQIMPAVSLLTKAVNRELSAINLFQCFGERANPGVGREHFGKLMENDKHHVAQFIAALYELTCEPPPLPEHDGNIM